MEKSINPDSFGWCLFITSNGIVNVVKESLVNYALYLRILTFIIKDLTVEFTNLFPFSEGSLENTPP